MWKSNFKTWNFELQLHKKLVFQAQHVNHWKKNWNPYPFWKMNVDFLLQNLCTGNCQWMVSPDPEQGAHWSGDRGLCTELLPTGETGDPVGSRHNPIQRQEQQVCGSHQVRLLDWLGTIKMEYNICFSVFSSLRLQLRFTLSLLSTIVEYTCIRQSSDFETIKDPLWISKTSIAYLL